MVIIPDSDSRVTHIYALVDPNTEQIRYIGKADNPNERLTRHLRIPEINSRNHKANWLRNLLASGLRPNLIILETVLHSEWQQAERKWIAYHRSIGTPLTNSTSGGDGIDKGTKFSDATRAKMSSSRMGRQVSQETRLKLSKTNSNWRPSEAQRQTLSNSAKKAWESLSESEKAAKINRLRHDWSEESRKKVSESSRGKKRSTSSSQYSGVAWFKRYSCWRAFIHVDKKQKHLGYYQSEIDAARAYNEASYRYFGESAYLNPIPD